METSSNYGMVSNIIGCVGWALAGFCFIGGGWIVLSAVCFVVGIVL